jgi:hypothetical protein
MSAFGDELRERVEPIVGDVRQRVEPLVEQAKQAAERSVAKARELWPDGAPAPAKPAAKSGPKAKTSV